MFTRQQQDRVRQMVERITDIRLPGSIVVSQGKGLTVKYAPEACSVQAEDMNALSRGFFLVARAIKEGRRTASISQNRAIASCGVMLDVSRRGCAYGGSCKAIYRLSGRTGAEPVDALYGRYL